MRGGVIHRVRAETPEIDRTIPLTNEQLFTRKIARQAKALWPEKTAAEWAFRAGVSERLAQYWLADPPGRDVSAEGLSAVNEAINSRSVI